LLYKLLQKLTLVAGVSIREEDIESSSPGGVALLIIYQLSMPNRQMPGFTDR